MKTTLKRTALVGGAILGLSGAAFCQQTIFNVPSADITPKGANYFETESQFRPWLPGSYWAISNFYARGVGGNTEVDVTQFNLSDPTADNLTLGTGFKTSLPISDRGSLRFTFGGQLLSSLDNKGEGYWAYAHLSGKIPGWKTRLTAGISNGTHQLFGSQATSFIGGLEQPISPSVSWINDWFSGSNSMGFFTTGFSIGVSSKTTVYLGYQFPNVSATAGRQGLTGEVSYLF